MTKRKKGIDIDFWQFREYAEKLDRLGGDLKSVFTDALEQAAATVEEDTLLALEDKYLPAGGIYSTGETEKSVIRNAKAEWSGNIGEIGVGFDKSKPGVGTLLITGTPRMRPDMKLEDIYARRKYQNELVAGIKEILQAEIEDKMEG